MHNAERLYEQGNEMGSQSTQSLQLRSFLLPFGTYIQVVLALSEEDTFFYSVLGMPWQMSILRGEAICQLEPRRFSCQKVLVLQIFCNFR
jgi:hypothetical protein